MKIGDKALTILQHDKWGSTVFEVQQCYIVGVVNKLNEQDKVTKMYIITLCDTDITNMGGELMMDSKNIFDINNMQGTTKRIDYLNKQRKKQEQEEKLQSLKDAENQFKRFKEYNFRIDWDSINTKTQKQLIELIANKDIELKFPNKTAMTFLDNHNAHGIFGNLKPFDKNNKQIIQERIEALK